jgi:hypothetical protein
MLIFMGAVVSSDPVNVVCWLVLSMLVVDIAVIPVIVNVGTVVFSDRGSTVT